MTLMSRLLARLYKLPPAETYDIVVEKKLAAPMADGVILRADRYYPHGQPKLPVVLIRTPYGRAGNAVPGYLMAERGLQVVIQSYRGTDDSGGELSAFCGERDDGLANHCMAENAALVRCPGMTGPGYPGFTQWAVARDAGATLKAFSTHVTSSEVCYGHNFTGSDFNPRTPIAPRHCN